MYFSWAFCNSAIIACFTALAIYFDKWWIVLFSALFVFSIKSKNTDDQTKEE